MSLSGFRGKIENALTSIDIEIGGGRPRDITIHDERLFNRLLSKGSLGLGEAYMDGWWDCQALDELIAHALRHRFDQLIKSRIDVFDVIKSRLLNLQTPRRSLVVGQQHYDIGNTLYEKMLDKRMMYSCGYWKNATNLDQAQEAKLDLVCKKLNLTPGMRVLDIGCGWGGAARFMAENYHVNVVGVTISKEQAEYAQAHCKGLPVEIHLMDYRSLTGSFDRIYSLGMFEHVGYKNYTTYFHHVRRLLREDGLFLLHTIANNRSVKGSDPWISRYIFPNSMLPSAKDIATRIEHHFIIEDWHNFGADYDKTLISWFKNFDAHWQELKGTYDNQFYRMWKYYLLICAGSFRARRNQVWQIVLSPNGVPGGYTSIR